MILAAACFSPSQSFYDWIINNEYLVNMGQLSKEMDRPSMILTTMWVFVLFAVLIAIPDIILILAIIGTIFILRIPSLVD